MPRRACTPFEPEAVEAYLSTAASGRGGEDLHELQWKYVGVIGRVAPGPISLVRIT